MIIEHVSQSSGRLRNSRRSNRSALARVASLRPCDTQKTECPEFFAEAATDIPISPGCRMPMFCVVSAFSPEVLTKFGIASCRRYFCKYSRKSRTGTQIHASHLINETVLLKRPDQGISKGLFYARYNMLPYSPNLAIMVNKYCGSSSCLVARTGVSK